MGQSFRIIISVLLIASLIEKRIAIVMVDIVDNRDIDEHLQERRFLY